jgi:hypothetical protein
MVTSAVAPAGVDPSVTLAQAAYPASSNSPLAQSSNDSSQADPQLEQYIAAQQQSAQRQSQPNIAQKIWGFIVEHWVQITLASAVVVGGGLGAKHLWWDKRQKSIEPSSKKKAKVEELDDDVSSSKTKFDASSGELPGLTKYKDRVNYIKKLFEKYEEAREQEKNCELRMDEARWDLPPNYDRLINVDKFAHKVRQVIAAYAPAQIRTGKAGEKGRAAKKDLKIAEKRRVEIALQIEIARAEWAQEYLEVQNELGNIPVLT